jgi:hypothetical protein
VVWGRVAIVAALLALGAGQHPSMNQYDSRSSEARRPPCQRSRATQTAASAAECQQMYARTDRVFRQSQRKQVGARRGDLGPRGRAAAYRDGATRETGRQWR